MIVMLKLALQTLTKGKKKITLMTWFYFKITKKQKCKQILKNNNNNKSLM